MARYRTKITPRQAVFIDEYLVDLSLTQAAIRAGYSPKFAGRQGFKLMQLPHIQAAIQARSEARAKRTHLDQDRVLRELAAVAFFDPRKLFAEDGTPRPLHELDDATAAAINSLDIQEVFEGSGEERTFVGYVKKYKVCDKNVALANAMKHLGLLKESVSISSPGGGPVEVSVKQEISASLSAAIKEVLRARRG